jgi:hypothetical protein
MDLALVMLVFFALGYGLDRWLGTSPAFTIGFVVFAMIGQFVAMWYRYDASMRQHESARAAAARSTTWSLPGPDASRPDR